MKFSLLLVIFFIYNLFASGNIYDVQYTLVAGEDLALGLRSGEVQLWSLPTLRLQAVSSLKT
jgi:hypothetical protein